MYMSIRIHKLTIWVAFFLLLSGITALKHPEAISVSAPTEEPICLPIIMYHGMLKDPERQGKYVISPDTFETDLSYLQKNGFHTIVVQDLIDYVYNDVSLPEKPIMLTFDDGYLNNYIYAFPLLQKYRMKMVLSPIGKYCDQYTASPDTNANYAQVTWENLKEMMDSGLVEIQNHSYNLHTNSKNRSGAKKNKGESPEEYRKMLMADLGEMQQKMLQYTGKEPTAFTYPFGAISEASLNIIKEMGFKASFSCEERINYITHDPDCLYLLGRYLRPENVKTEDYFERILCKEKNK